MILMKMDDAETCLCPVEWMQDVMKRSISKAVFFVAAMPYCQLHVAHVEFPERRTNASDSTEQKMTWREHTRGRRKASSISVRDQHSDAATCCRHISVGAVRSLLKTNQTQLHVSCGPSNHRIPRAMAAFEPIVASAPGKIILAVTIAFGVHAALALLPCLWMISECVWLCRVNMR